ncbi:hypothetical protein BCAR13_410031 [Paraburkholderia caribensis]|uniref:hypothetical protein n=1 Tax=Paraburkholderia caribensis TaxID=75105 RepID=UPI001CAD44E8|nr:hypothetical protein [Paraburkholderia caribensis]CAG9219224.1 hypothetical protein BCAR13_410031 [Paraburkholderia caribensis]
MWLDRIQRSNGKFLIVGISSDGMENIIELQDAYRYRLSCPQGRYLRASTSFGLWSRATARQYAAGYSMTKGVTEHHVIYSFSCNSMKILLPSWILQRDLFSPPNTMFKYLYTIYGLECLCYRKVSESGYSVELTPTHDKHHLLASTKHALDRITWFFSYPSANRAWKSVYDYARCGEIGLELPDAEITYSVHGNVLGDTLFADHFRVTTLRPIEGPMDWAASAQKEFRFDERSNHDVKPRYKTDKNLLRKDGTFVVSDQEWLEIESMMMRTGNRTSSQNRELLNGIIQKFALGLPWSGVSRLADGCSADKEYRILLRKKRWSDIKEVLLKRRSKSKSAEKMSVDSDFIKKTRFGGRLRDHDLPSRISGMWTMSTREWDVIRPIIRKSTRMRATSLARHRLIVDSIICKLAIGSTWADVARTHGIPRTTLLRAYETLKRDGQWAKIRAVLCDARIKGVPSWIRN